MLAMFGHFVSYMLMLGHKNMQAYFCDTRYRMFHVKHSQGFQAKRHLCIFIWKPQGVGLSCSYRPNTIASVATGCSHTGMTEHETIRL